MAIAHICISLLACLRSISAAPLIDAAQIGVIRMSQALSPPQIFGVLQVEADADKPVTTTPPPSDGISERAPYVDDLRTQYPQCPLTCEVGWTADGWCDVECANESCGNDEGDCDGWCAPDCKPEWKDDGFCDLDCYREECDFDGKDCKGKFDDSVVIPAPKHEDFDYANCKCNQTLLNNDECDQECMNSECNWDGQDCLHQCNADCASMWLGDGDCDDVCNTAECGYDKGDCGECAAGCFMYRLGNGLCDPSCDNEACEYDRGDCEGVCHTWEYSYNVTAFEYPNCRDEFIGDGACDCYCLHEKCSYDGGDCTNTDCFFAFKDIPGGDKALKAYAAWEAVRQQNTPNSQTSMPSDTQTDTNLNANSYLDTNYGTIRDFNEQDEGIPQPQDRRRRRSRNNRP